MMVGGRVSMVARSIIFVVSLVLLYISAHIYLNAVTLSVARQRGHST